jgi:tyrosyl-tRNA synthetase
MSDEKEKIEKVLTRGVAEILPSKDGLAKLMAEKKITLYQGFDPSSDSLHIGNWIGIRKLAQFQELGHKIIFLIGDFTGMIGDPTDKSAARKKLTKEQTVKNAKDYAKQAGKTLKFEGPNAAKVLFNSEWLSKLTFEDVAEMASNFTVQQMLERDFFQKRLEENKPIYLHEFLYPLMQGIDCMEMGVDLEIGGNDQLFNMLAGRTLMKAVKNKEKYVLAMKLLTDPTGQKMGKSKGNVIRLDSTPTNIYGQIMALPDDLLDLEIELLTDLSLNLTKDFKPLEVKKKVAFDVIKQIFGETKAKEAQEEFEKRHQDRTGPEKPLEVSVKDSVQFLDEIVAEVKDISRSEAKRLIMSGSVDIEGETITNPKQKLDFPSNLKIGKATFVKVNKK